MVRGTSVHGAAMFVMSGTLALNCALDEAGSANVGGMGGIQQAGSGGLAGTGAGAAGAWTGGTGGQGGAPMDASDGDASLGGAAGSGGTGGFAGADASDSGEAGSTGWSPSSIPNCALWLDGADVASLGLIGADVQVWGDKCANTPVTSNGTAKPSYVPGLLNGNGGVRLDGIDDFLEVGGQLKNSNAFVMFFVVTLRSTSFPHAPLWSNRHLAGPTGGTVTYFGLATEVAYLFQDSAASKSLLGSQLVGTQPRLVELFSGSSGRELRVDGVVDASDSSAPLPTKLPNGFVGTDKPNGWFAAIDVFEIVAYDRDLTSGERAIVRDALNKKWAL